MFAIFDPTWFKWGFVVSEEKFVFGCSLLDRQLRRLEMGELGGMHALLKAGDGWRAVGLVHEGRRIVNHFIYKSNKTTSIFKWVNQAA